ncbi:uncharacterized protein F4822DRAFT_418484 [Hypoxylon trugodes]|uniref:uncharacterized protein n=1 Tax=Hypoxylon trugodes TaxID=326681 RepID=UPI002199D536|nr:uncharacterized protein F4822DRAFT_418484 [Hypoxylon trugodes]KAI1384052.1 hypothetical protein F4822DRAFT_418484 [Hypoxylon trugodes]
MNGFNETSPGSGPVRVDGVTIKEEEPDHDQVNGQAFKDIDWAAQAAKDEDDISKMFDMNGKTPMSGGMSMSEALSQFESKEIDQTNKADDAIDFEDISDSDLASEDGSSAAAGVGISQVPGLTEDEGTSHDTEYMDDLFGGGPEGENDYLPSSPPPQDTTTAHSTSGLTMPNIQNIEKAPVVKEKDVTDEAWKNMSFEERQRLNFPQLPLSIDKWMNQMSKEDSTIQRAPESVDELLAQKFPGFKKHKVLFFNQLFPEWPAEYMYKEPPHKDRDPPEFVPTKLELELEADSSKLFRIPDTGLTSQTDTYSDGEDWGLDATESYSDDSGSEQTPVGGFVLDEITTICDEWDASLAQLEAVVAEPLASSIAHEDTAKEDIVMDDWDKEFMNQQTKKTQAKYTPGLPIIRSFDTAGVDDFERETRRSSKRVRLEESDPYLLLCKPGELERPAKRPKVEEKTIRMANGQLRKDAQKHYNLSNDDAYDALKLNHKSKVRATLSSLAVEHSLPALKLTFPFYRVKVDGKFWEHHRKKFDIEKVVKHAIGVRKPSKVKKRDLKGRTPQEIFRTTKDLSMNDNSTAILFEYCEEFPIMMSNFGMGNRVINYYRRKDRRDEDKGPKLDIGESHTLLPEDRSPFSIFGTVDPGETVPTLHNEMYRAPVFKHEPRQTDFLLGFSTNATEGPRFYLRNIDYVYTVGQCFPSVDVPGPHARKVTNTAKNRLKMIAYRMMKKKPTKDIALNELSPHVFDKIDPQNRQKMKEFLFYDKDSKTWVLPEGKTLLDEPAIRSMIKPEDACLIEAMQVGQQLLVNAGYDPKDKTDGEHPAAEGSLAARMAPWELTKNFNEATQSKAMVALHGEGDPTGHGLGFSFIRTSMKGGYINAVQGPLATSADAIERERKANGGHSYNVKKQADMYNAAIQQIWERQKSTLSDVTTHDDADVLDTSNEDDRFNSRQVEATPVPLDDGRSQFSRLSGASRSGKKKLKITRKKRNEDGEIVTETIILENPVVIRNYLKQRRENEEKNRDVYSLQPTADADDNREKQKLVERELSRLLKNQDRRQVREKQQGKSKKKKNNNNNNNNDAAAGSPDPSAADKASAGTTRKCANCGQVGHIKTNKSKCPLLNGTIPTDNGGADHGGFGSFGSQTAGATPANE